MQQYPVFTPLADRPSAHCATLTELPDGALMCAWFGGAYEGASDVVLLAARRDRGSPTWSRPWVIAAVPGYALGQPVFLPRPDGELWLFFVVIMERPTHLPADASGMPPWPSWTSAQPFMQRSRDNGLTWGASEQLFDAPGFMFRSRPLVLPGRIIVPVYSEKTWQSMMMISDDDGVTWRLTPPLVTPSGNIHASLARLTSGRLLAYLRTGGKGGVIWRTTSDDQGDTWANPEPTGLPNPNSGIDLLRLQSGHLLLAFNNSATGRTPLTVALGDENENWAWLKNLETDPAEFSYPTLWQTADALIHVVYTYKREHIHYACFTEAWLREG